MRDGGRLSAAIEVISSVTDCHEPPKAALRHYARTQRHAGATDRAFVSGLVHDCLRRRASMAAIMDDPEPRSLVLATVTRVWNWDSERLERACRDTHGPGALTHTETRCLAAAQQDATLADHIAGDYPNWLTGSIRRAFGDQAVPTMQAMTQRAPVDLRVNSLKTDVDRARTALKSLKEAELIEALAWGIRIRAQHPQQRRPAPMSLPAFSRGWIEVQDMGSQIAAAAVAATPTEQIVDYCAGGGGKTLALAAAMSGRGQIHAYDIDNRRLSAILPRLKRAGAHNVQIYRRDEHDRLGLADAVLVDAPCSGSGAWRRRPDTKWRLTEPTLARRCADQDAILSAAADHVRPGGRLIYVTCSILPQENQDRVDQFLARTPGFERADTAQWACESGMLSDSGCRLVRDCCDDDLAVRLNPLRSDCDGFFIAALGRRAEP